MPSTVGSLRQLAGSAAALVQTRVEFATVELAQTRAQLARWALLGAIALLLALLALATATVWATLLLWERFGLATLFVLALVYGAVAFWLIKRVQRELREAPPLLADTLHELARDRAALFGEPERDSPPAP